MPPGKAFFRSDRSPEVRQACRLPYQCRIWVVEVLLVQGAQGQAPVVVLALHVIDGVAVVEHLQVLHDPLHGLGVGLIQAPPGRRRRGIRSCASRAGSAGDRGGFRRVGSPTRKKTLARAIPAGSLSWRKAAQASGSGSKTSLMASDSAKRRGELLRVAGAEKD